MALLKQMKVESSTDLSKFQNSQTKFIPKKTHHLTISALYQWSGWSLNTFLGFLVCYEAGVDANI